MILNCWHSWTCLGCAIVSYLDSLMTFDPEKLQSAPLSQRPRFQKMHSFFLPLPLGDWVLDGKRPLLLSRLGLVDRGLLDGTSCLYVQLSFVHPPLFHFTQHPLRMKPTLPSTAGAEGLAVPERFRATLSQFVSRRSRSRCLRTAETRKSYFLFSVPASAR